MRVNHSRRLTKENRFLFQPGPYHEDTQCAAGQVPGGDGRRHRGSFTHGGRGPVASNLHQRIAECHNPAGMSCESNRIGRMEYRPLLAHFKKTMGGRFFV